MFTHTHTQKCETHLIYFKSWEKIWGSEKKLHLIFFKNCSKSSKYLIFSLLVLNYFLSYCIIQYLILCNIILHCILLLLLYVMYVMKWYFPKLEDKRKERGRPQKEHLHWWPILHELQLMSHQNSNRQTGIDENPINCEQDFVNKCYSAIFLPPSNWPVGRSLTEQQEPSSRTSQSWGLIPFASDAPHG